MKLGIDTSNTEMVVVFLDDERFESVAKVEKSQKLLAFIDEIFKKKKIGMHKIDEIEVNLGPGSFTGLRVGVSVANAIGWVLGVRVNGKDLRKGEVVDIRYK